MEIGMIGLGRMGANMTARLARGGHHVVAYDRDEAARQDAAATGARAVASLGELVTALTGPRVIWLMVPAGVVDSVLDELAPSLAAGDLVVDGGNSHYQDDLRRAARLADAGIAYADVGTSGGIWGAERGYCLMAGGSAEAIARLVPIFETLAPGLDAAPRSPGRTGVPSPAERGYLHCGPTGAGHFVKMVHNGIEYGLMAAYAEGLNILRHANVGATSAAADAETAPLRNPEHYQYDFDLGAITELWRRGSVVGSWLLDLTARALHASPDLDGYAGRVSDSGEGRWTLVAAIESGVPAPVLHAALAERFTSRGHAEFANKVLSAMRHQFGGHVEKRD